jgi:two-component system, OmpR family, phosphate regulon sensor histidine kinase PhoR
MIRLTRIWKLYVFYTVVLIAGVTLVGFIVERQVGIKLEEHLIDDGLTLAKVIQKALPDTDDPSVLDEFCRLYQNMAGMRLTLIGKDGKVMGESERKSLELEKHMDRPEVQEAMHGKVGTSIRVSGTLKLEMLYVGLPVDERGRILRVAVPMTVLRRFENELMAFFSIGLYLMPVLVIITAFLFAKYRIREKSPSQT